MTQMNAGTVLVKSLEMAGIKTLYGLPGNEEVCDALIDSSIECIWIRKDENAGYMAEAYAKFTGHPGVAMGEIGPGPAQLVTAAYTAYLESTPMVILTFRQPISLLDKGAMEDIDQVAMFEPVTKWNTLVLDSTRIPEMVQRAVRIATTGRRGPVHLDFPADVLQQSIAFEGFDPVAYRPSSLVVRGDPAAITTAADLILSATRPAILAGGGCIYTPRPCPEELTELAELIAAPVAATFNGIGAFAGTHELSIGRLGWLTTDYTKEFIAQADVLIAIGCRFSGVATANFTLIPPGAKLIHIDTDPEEIGKNYPVSVGIVGDAKSVIPELIDSLKARDYSAEKRYAERTAAIREAKENWTKASGHEEKATSDALPLKPQRVAREVRRHFGEETVVVSDGGSIHFWPIYEGIATPGTWINNGAAGPLGYGLPGAIAVKHAAPDKEVLVVAGDGGFMMSSMELSTAVAYELGLIVVIYNNSYWGFIKNIQKTAWNERYIGVELTNPDFASYARSFGAEGIRIERPEQIAPALKKASETAAQSIPVVLDFIVDVDERLYDWCY